MAARLGAVQKLRYALGGDGGSVQRNAALHGGGGFRPSVTLRFDLCTERGQSHSAALRFDGFAQRLKIRDILQGDSWRSPNNFLNFSVTLPTGGEGGLESA